MYIYIYTFKNAEYHDIDTCQFGKNIQTLHDVMPKMPCRNLSGIRDIFDDVHHHLHNADILYHILIASAMEKLWMISHIPLWNPKLLRKHSPFSNTVV